MLGYWLCCSNRSSHKLVSAHPALTNDFSSSPLRDQGKPPLCPGGAVPLGLPTSARQHSPAELGVNHSALGPSKTVRLTFSPPSISTSQQVAPGLNPEWRRPTDRGTKACARTCASISKGVWETGRCPCSSQGTEAESCPEGSCVHTSSHRSPSESRGDLPSFSLTLTKFPGLKPSSNFLSTCASHPCLSCFFPILSIRGSPEFKNRNETWRRYLCPLLASSVAVPHTLHHRCPRRQTLLQPAASEPMRVSCLELDFRF